MDLGPFLKTPPQVHESEVCCQRLSSSLDVDINVCPVISTIMYYVYHVAYKSVLFTMSLFFACSSEMFV